MAGMKALLISCDVEGPELDDGLGHLLSPTHSRTLHPVLDEILARALDGATGDGPALGEIFVITHARAIAA